MEFKTELEALASEIESMFSMADHLLVDAISERIPQLSRAEVTQWILGLDVRFTVRDVQPLDPNVTLLDLIEAGVLSSPLRLFREYKRGPHRGECVEAVLRQDGTIEVY